ncbi:MAG: response regulator [Deltaproteobacteria bacterium]|nr:response regulator [Deltaproteobacteria bacterium]
MTRHTTHHSLCSSSTHVPVVVVQPWEDEDAVQVCRRTLELWGFRSTCTSDIEQALQLIAENGSRALVVDLDMPGHDVLALVGALRSHEATSDVAVLATTRTHDAAVEQLALESGCDVVLCGELDPHLVAGELEAAVCHPGRRMARPSTPPLARAC